MNKVSPKMAKIIHIWSKWRQVREAWSKSYCHPKILLATRLLGLTTFSRSGEDDKQVLVRIKDRPWWEWYTGLYFNVWEQPRFSICYIFFNCDIMHKVFVGQELRHIVAFVSDRYNNFSDGPSCVRAVFITFIIII